MQIRWLVFLFIAFFSPSVTKAAITIDARFDEDEWRQASTLGPLVSVQPFTQAEPKFKTKVRYVSTPEGIAFAFENEHPAGLARVKSNSPRDGESQNDRVNVMLDFDGDGKIGYDLTISLASTVDDYVISNENQFRADWDGNFQHAVSETESGWNMEIILPWSMATMRTVQTDTRKIAVYVDRVIGANNERFAFPAIRFSDQQFLSKFAPIEVTQYSQSVLNWYPYVTGIADLVSSKNTLKTGLDVFWKPSGSFQLTAALNPDFGQVESDDLVVNFSALETFFSDKRPFFTENQAFFDLPTAQGGSLIYTRRMGGPSDDGDGIADIDAALKTNGSIGDINYGFFGVLESGHADDLGSAFYATRLLRSGEKFSIGATNTFADRPFLQRTASVNMIDAQFNPSDSLRINTHILQSDIEDDDGDTDGKSGRASFQYTFNNGIFAELAAAHLSDDVDLNDMGFLPRNGLNVQAATLGIPLNSFTTESEVRSINIFNNVVARRTLDGFRVPTRLNSDWNFDFRNGGRSNFELTYDTAGYDDLISRGNGYVKRQSGWAVFGNYNSPRLNKWQFDLNAWYTDGGIDFDQNFQLDGGLSYFATDQLNLSLRVNKTHVRDSIIWQEDTLFGRFKRDQGIVNMNLNWSPKAKHELRARIQWLGIQTEDASAWRLQTNGDLIASDELIENFLINNIGMQMRYRWEFAPQSDFYAVYSRGGDEFSNSRDDGLTDIFADALSFRDADQVVLKVRYRF